MRKHLAPLVGVAIAALALAGGTTAQNGPPTGKKTWICHLANTNKYVGIQVSKKALAKHVSHGPDLVADVPQSRAARAFCRNLPVLTARRGGMARTAELTNATNQAVTGTFRLRARIGQGQICFTANVSGGGATDITSLTITGNGNTLTLNVTGTETSESACVNVDRALVKQLLRSSDDFTVTAVVDIPGSSVTLTGTLER